MGRIVLAHYLDEASELPDAAGGRLPVRARPRELQVIPRQDVEVRAPGFGLTRHDLDGGVQGVVRGLQALGELRGGGDRSSYPLLSAADEGGHGVRHDIVTLRLAGARAGRGAGPGALALRDEGRILGRAE